MPLRSTPSSSSPPTRKRKRGRIETNPWESWTWSYLHQRRWWRCRRARPRSASPCSSRRKPSSSACPPGTPLPPSRTTPDGRSYRSHASPIWVAGAKRTPSPCSAQPLRDCSEAAAPEGDASLQGPRCTSFCRDPRRGRPRRHRGCSRSAASPLMVCNPRKFLRVFLRVVKSDWDSKRFYRGRDDVKWLKYPHGGQIFEN